MVVVATPPETRSGHGRAGRSRGLAAAVLTGAATLAVAGSAAGPAAARRHAPCPTTGTTIARDRHPNVRVWHRGAALRACLRAPGTARKVRSLGPWRTGIHVAVDEGTVAWALPDPDVGAAADAVTSVDLASGHRWLSTAHAVPATPSAPAADDRVVELLTNGRATGWVTAGGTVAAAVKALDPGDPAMLGDAPAPHVGRRFLLASVGADAASDTARTLAFVEGGDSDDCGGEADFTLQFRDPAASSTAVFTYARDVYAADPAICG